MQTAPCVTIDRMTGYATGIPTRRNILKALLAKEPRTIRGLALEIGKDVSTVFSHLQHLTADDLIIVERKRGRRGAEVSLTAAGRAAALMLEEDAKTAS